MQDLGGDEVIFDVPVDVRSALSTPSPALGTGAAAAPERRPVRPAPSVPATDPPAAQTPKGAPPILARG